MEKLEGMSIEELATELRTVEILAMKTELITKILKANNLADYGGE